MDPPFISDEWIHLSWGKSLYFDCIAAITTDEISMLTISQYPLFTISSDITAHMKAHVWEETIWKA